MGRYHRAECMLKGAGLLLTGALAVGCDADASPETTSPETGSALAPVQYTDHVMTATTTTRGNLKLKPSVTGCEQSGGPYVTISGEMYVGGAGMNLIFQNNEKGTHKSGDIEATIGLNMIPYGQSIQVPKSVAAGGAGGNPLIYMQLFDDKWNPITDEFYLGRCKKGLGAKDLYFDLPTDLSAYVDLSGCTNHPGPYIYVDEAIVMSGLNGRMRFKNNTKGTHTTDPYETTVDMVITPTDGPIHIAKQPSIGGVGGNPRLYGEFTDGEGEAVSESVYFGKCIDGN
ncbi:MAG: hypothetical protein AB2A00_02110 [Myxococcota bacterium]